MTNEVPIKCAESPRGRPKFKLSGTTRLPAVNSSGVIIEYQADLTADWVRYLDSRYTLFDICL